jgi:hypothetical protein
VAKSGTFTYELRANCAPEEAVALLSDFSRHTELHPYIVKVTEVPPTTDAIRSFVINDRLAFGPFRFTTTYTADVLAINRLGPGRQAEVITLARQRPGTTLRNRARIYPISDGGVRIDVTITLTAPTPLFGYAFRTARQAHHALAERLREVLDSTASDPTV